MAISKYTEDLSSHIPALDLLIKLGYKYITPSQSVELRGGKKGKVVLEGVLKEWLSENNSIESKGSKHSFSESNITKAVEVLSNKPFDALLKDNEDIYDLLTLGKSFEQTIEGDTKSHSLKYIDWKNPKNNVFHVTDEFEVEKRHSNQTRRPDIVLFVNGIPLVVIECKRPDKKGALKEGISQQQRNQMVEEIPHLFTFSQILMSCCQNLAKYGTAATPEEYWMVWKEEDDKRQEENLKSLINLPIDENNKASIFKEKKDYQLRYMEKIWDSGERLPSPQDKAIDSLLRPDRLLDLTYGFIVFDNKVKKVCRYQQYFAINATLNRVTDVKGDSQRKGGVIWHTTGSGKSLTMVMMAKALTLEPSIKNPRVILVTDRVDLDDQIWKTFKACGKDVEKASSGKNLLKLIEDGKADIITTVIDKFESASKEKDFKSESHNIFVLVDESHRSQYGVSHAKMVNIFPKACYLGFTGTPLLKKEKTTAKKFGGFIHKYTMNQAVKDGAVVPLLYEGRMSELRGDKAQLDRWFERITDGLTDKQKADLKNKFKREEELLKADQRLMEIAYDIREHFLANYKGTGFKGQLACSSKQDAVRYKKYFADFKDIKVDVIISAPDTREEHSDIDESDVPEVQLFWKDMMNRYGNETKYTENIIKAFKYSDEPEILIVVDKLLTGFDAPKNSVLYIDKRLKDHNILQAIARVNRVFEGKGHGLIVDYRGIFGEINSAIDTYAALENEGFEREDVEGTLINVELEIKELAQRHTNVWEVFKEVTNKSDIEAMQRHLEPEDIRQEFYKRLTSFSKTLQLALSNPKFQDETEEKIKQMYQNDLKTFINLRASIKQRYGETVDYSTYEKQIRNMVNKYVGADQVKIIIDQTSIFDEEDFEKELESIEGDAAKADTIASRIKRTINEKMDEDPALYKKLSEMIDEAIQLHREKRLNDAQYLSKVREGLDELRGKSKGNSYPDSIRNNDDAKAYFGILKEYIDLELTKLGDIAEKVFSIIEENKERDWDKPHKEDVQNLMINDIEDHLFMIKGKFDLDLPHDKMDLIIERLMMTAKRRN
ncbi:type I restriction endonuclease subunit R [Halobacteriovorax sp. DA5]|uniref:type I restriction endonuclease subunit R n=1 Tax=Halobacteriovorax sp. DA5 TaxID=2067553 RepID=UPI000CD0B514|nr:HsdR family type I site-specific deoxyribonuclease [Halobacteriovorax sp. DA5]POB13852.1 restriction endonuclease subunit R [Halobacteriovorax sp. DA5]